ncbi:MAG: DUF4954 family protein [Termitinemataceae bacterium]|nr:MAG: DUF4954 family protein [Termitinemataceae bacterium]
MGTTFVESTQRYGYDFIPAEFLPHGENEYYLRNRQLAAILSQDGNSPAIIKKRFRKLTKNEIEKLLQNNNECSNWDDFLVTDKFDPCIIKNNSFAGLIRLDNTTAGLLKYHDYVMHAGITNSTIISCDIGSSCAIHNCHYISHYIIGSECILSNIDEIDTTNHAKFGEGILKDGEDESVRIWIDPLNESGGRSVLPFCEMNCADAYMWTVYRSDKKLSDAFKRITQSGADSMRGYYGVIGKNSVIKHCETIKDVNIGESAYIKGANKLKNLTIKSCKNEPTQIGEGVEIVNGIVGYGCRIFYGSKAVRFVIGNNCSLKYGARLIHSILGDNSTVSCCEVLNNLVFPAHEQHHNNSFLIASILKGQTNMAAGATVGSNHNSRGNDGEIVAGRGFWPGLASAVKHNSKFASYTLIAKGNYPFELNTLFPFCLITNNTTGTRRLIMPAYWWMYNMYAMERNAWKFKSRDNRYYVNQYYETDYLAPDTVQEIIASLNILDMWALEADSYDRILVPPRFLERSDQPVRVVKVRASRKAYHEMLCYYAVKTLCTYLTGVNIVPNYSCKNIFEKFQKDNLEEISSASFMWENLGGQLVPLHKVKKLCNLIRTEKINSWKEIHAEYDRLLQEYPFDKAVNAVLVLRYLNNSCSSADFDNTKNSILSEAVWQDFLNRAEKIRITMEDQIYKTKSKDYKDTFRMITYLSEKERDNVLGKLEENQFILQAKKDTACFMQLINQFKK